MEPVRLQPSTCLPLLLLERTRVNTVFLHRGDTSIEREVCVKIRKFRLIATIVLSLFFFFSLDSYILIYVHTWKRTVSYYVSLRTSRDACHQMLFVRWHFA
jgi:hypothetical protein